MSEYVTIMFNEYMASFFASMGKIFYTFSVKIIYFDVGIR